MLHIENFLYRIEKEIVHMKKRAILFCVFLILLLFTGCSRKEVSLSTSQVLSELKETSCNTADRAGTCFTRLPELGIISPAECCEQLGKCCQNENN